MRIAMLSVHSSPLATLGGKEAGGMNVYVRELARELGRRGISVDVFTRSQDPTVPQIVHADRNVRVVNLHAGPAAPYDKNLLLSYLPEFVSRVRCFADAGLPAGVRRIGLAWTGRPTHPNDQRRSMSLACLASLADAGPSTFVSLQKPLPGGDLATMTRFPGMTDLSHELTDFGETAAVIENLDLIITVDTAIGHLAGALGKPVWILIAKAADWRWMLERSDSPWYPSARLFRQDRPGAWEPAIDRVRSALEFTQPLRPV